ncbi:Bax inhibitor 1 [Sciurus carolinensis]|uniref:Bax inhibitor 1 n=1 Tax=Sciurus carolinensis TaxID=30640 RepID=A0AA41MP32_SCICA|nr:Bax inhibitor 1 [Sciurus carolinensis]
MATPHCRETKQKRLGLLTGFAFFTGITCVLLWNCALLSIPASFPGLHRHSNDLYLLHPQCPLHQVPELPLSGKCLDVSHEPDALVTMGNLFFGSIWLFQANLYMGLVNVYGFVLFDTQLIIEKAGNGNKDYVWHCVDLFLDFLTLFRKLTMILAMNEKDKKKEK